jgi:arylsulfatase A-like enzyme
MRNEEVVEQPATQETLTPRYTTEAVKFIRTHQDDPFLLYLPYTFPHTPLYASNQFRDTSRRGLYGDVVTEIDWSVGEILSTLRELDLAEQTFVFFTSDNGPWLSQKQDGGSAGLLREGKGSTWEGGMREPAIAWWPGRIQADVITPAIGSTMDLFATCLSLADIPLPSDRIIDGKDLSPVLFGTGPSPRKTMFYYRGTCLMAIRKGPWKAHFYTQGAYGIGGRKRIHHDPPALYQLEHDPSEKYDIHDQHPDVIADLVEKVEQHRANLKAPPSPLDDRIPSKKLGATYPYIDVH